VVLALMHVSLSIEELTVGPMNEEAASPNSSIKDGMFF
jgi:hypothetical protein